MHGRRTYAASTVPPVKGDSEKNVRGLRTAVGDEGFVGTAIKVRVVQIDVGKTMTRGGEVNHATAHTQKRRNPVDQHEVAEMICAELRLKTICRVAKGSCHHASVRDDRVQEL